MLKSFFFFLIIGYCSCHLFFFLVKNVDSSPKNPNFSRSEKNSSHDSDNEGQGSLVENDQINSLCSKESANDDEITLSPSPNKDPKDTENVQDKNNVSHTTFFYYLCIVVFFCIPI